MHPAVIKLYQYWASVGYAEPYICASCGETSYRRTHGQERGRTECSGCRMNRSRRNHREWVKRTGAARAGAMVAQAIRSGRLRPAKEFLCADCAKAAREYDHRDYNRPLAVDPVCHSCNIRRGPGIPLIQASA